MEDNGMPGRVRERELIVPALRSAAARSGGYISTSDLIVVLEEEFEPEGQDAEILANRHDTYFSQKVRNLISHKDNATSMFTKGYAVYTGDGIRITDAGRAFLPQVPEFE
jgi:hypothetical protein